MNYFEYIAILKSRPPKLDMLPYSSDLLIKGMNAWRQSFSHLGPFKWDIVLPDDDQARQDFLWKYAKFNLTRWSDLMGVSAPIGFFKDLITAGMIFPDGTARLGFLGAILTGPGKPTKEEEKDGKRTTAGASTTGTDGGREGKDDGRTNP